MLYLCCGKPVALDIAKRRQDVRIDPMTSIIASLSMCIQPAKVFFGALSNSIGAASNFASVMPSQMGKPLACSLLCLSE